MTFTPLTDPPGHLLNLLADTTEARTDTLDPDGLDQAGRHGWVYEFQGRVGADRSQMTARPKASTTGTKALASPTLMPRMRNAASERPRLPTGVKPAREKSEPNETPCRVPSRST
jgi:hypothetical protein